MKYSMQREIILNYVKQNPVHPTANHVYSALKKDHPNLSLGTVYRNLNKLSEVGLIYRIEVADAPDRFDGNIEPHHHAICVKCGEMFDFDINLAERTIIDSIVGKGFNYVSSYQININCLCDNCYDRKNDNH